MFLLLVLHVQELLHYLIKSFLLGKYKSLIYKQMPFILSPHISNLIVKFSRDKNNKSIDRYHNDGIKIDIDS